MESIQNLKAISPFSVFTRGIQYFNLTLSLLVKQGQKSKISSSKLSLLYIHSSFFQFTVGFQTRAIKFLFFYESVVVVSLKQETDELMILKE